MNKRCIVITTLCLGIAASPPGFQVSEALFTSAVAQDKSLLEDQDPSIVQENGDRHVSDQTPRVPQVSIIVDQIPTNVQPGPVVTYSGDTVVDRLVFQPLVDSVYSFSLTGGSSILTNVGSGVVATVPAMGPVPLTDRTVPLVNGVGRPSLSAGAITFDGEGQRYQIVLTSGAINITDEPTQPDLSKQFLELSNQLASLKLKRLHPQSLALEVEQLKKNISDVEAASKLDEAQEQLKRIMHDYPESPAAQSARRMLGGVTQDGPYAPTGPTRLLVPTPDIPASMLPSY